MSVAALLLMKKESVSRKMNAIYLKPLLLGLQREVYSQCQLEKNTYEIQWLTQSKIYELLMKEQIEAGHTDGAIELYIQERMAH